MLCKRDTRLPEQSVLTLGFHMLSEIRILLRLPNMNRLRVSLIETPRIWLLVK